MTPRMKRKRGILQKVWWEGFIRLPIYLAHLLLLHAAKVLLTYSNSNRGVEVFSGYVRGWRHALPLPLRPVHFHRPVEKWIPMSWVLVRCSAPHWLLIQEASQNGLGNSVLCVSHKYPALCYSLIGEWRKCRVGHPCLVRAAGPHSTLCQPTYSQIATCEVQRFTRRFKIDPTTPSHLPSAVVSISNLCAVAAKA